MATWIAHMRVAEKLMEKNKFKKLDEKNFLLGNIGPDSGVPNEDWSSFNPPKKITHWINDDKKICCESFYDKYLSDKDVKKDIERYSFLMGYYVHLLTDNLWSKMSHKKKEDPLYKDNLEKDPEFIWIIKKDWYGLDYLYLEKNPGSMFFRIFKNVDDVPDYLDYFPKGAFTKQVKYIKEFYLGENDETKENFIYLTEEEMDKFIKESVKSISEFVNV